MKRYLLVSLRLSAVMLVLCCVLYFFLIGAIGLLTPGGGGGETVTAKGRVVGYARIGQRFDQDKYFWGRPSAVNYNAAGSGGSNKAPANRDYLQTVSARIDSFLVHNPGIKKTQIPSEMVTASGSGLDPDISPASALIQVRRIAAVRGLSEEALRTLILKHVSRNPFGPDVVNVLKLNVALDELQ